LATDVSISLGCLETMGASYPVTRSHISEELISQLIPAKA